MRGFCFVFPECSEILGGLFLLTYLLIFLWAVLLLLLAHRRHLRLRLSLCSIDLTSVRVPGLDTGTILVVGSFSVQRTLLRILLILGTLTGALDEFCLILFKKKKNMIPIEFSLCSWTLLHSFVVCCVFHLHC